jgi:hypothetical protein
MTDTSKPAFPRLGEGFGDERYDTPGMTLREYAAIKAMQAIIIKSPFIVEPENFEVYEKTAIGAIDYADALLKELEK